jgi:hypothetical protein
LDQQEGFEQNIQTDLTKELILRGMFLVILILLELNNIEHWAGYTIGMNFAEHLIDICQKIEPF